MPAVATHGALIHALVSLAVLARIGTDEQVRFGPCPAPPTAAATLGLQERAARTLRVEAIKRDFGDPADDVLHLLRWAPDGHLNVSARNIAVRLACEPEKVLGALTLLGAQQEIEPEDFPRDPDVTLAITKVTPPPWTPSD